MDNDVEVVQRKRYQPCTKHFDGWRLPDGTQLFQWGCCYRSIDSLPDPLADTPEGWWEFGQILKWAHKQGWQFELGHFAGNYEAAVWNHPYQIGRATHTDFRAAIIAALAAAVRHESEAKE